MQAYAAPQGRERVAAHRDLALYAPAVAKGFGAASRCGKQSRANFSMPLPPG